MTRASNLLIGCLLTLALCGCGKQETVIDDKPPELPAAHAEQGPHGGELVELGSEEYHAELLDDDDSGKVTIYLLDSAATREVPIADSAITLNAMVDGKAKQFSLAAVLPEGKSETAQFELVDKTLIEALHQGAKAQCRLNVTIGGTPYIGKFEHDHDHGHGHDHADHKH